MAVKQYALIHKKNGILQKAAANSMTKGGASISDRRNKNNLPEKADRTILPHQSKPRTENLIRHPADEMKVHAGAAPPAQLNAPASAVVQLCRRKGCKIKGDHVHDDDKEDMSDGEKTHTSDEERIEIPPEEKKDYPMNEKQRISPQTQWGTPVNYNKSHYAKLARNLRRKNDELGPGSNVNVIKMSPEGKSEKPAYLVTSSRNSTKPEGIDRFKPLHSEEIAAILIHDKKLKDRKTLWDYTEREPCGHGKGLRNCRKKTLPKLKLESKDIYYSFPYPSKDDYLNPEDKEDTPNKAIKKAEVSRSESNALMKKTVNKIGAESDKDAEEMSEADYSVYYDSDNAPKDTKEDHILSMGRRTQVEVERLTKDAQVRKETRERKKREKEKEKEIMEQEDKIMTKKIKLTVGKKTKKAKKKVAEKKNRKKKNVKKKEEVGYMGDNEN